MVNTRSMTKKSNNEEGSVSWSNLDHDLVFLIMMHLGLFDFISFSGVCKSWRSLAVSNWNKFMLSRQPMYLSISSRLNNKELYLEDYNKRKLETAIQHSNDSVCVGLTCGYLVFFERKTRDFWLVNPFTRKELHFPGYPFGVTPGAKYIRGILVFSPSMSGRVLVVVTRRFGSSKIAFSLAGEEAAWFSVSTSYSARDLHFFKGRIYTLDDGGDHLCELRINPEPTLTLIKMSNFPWSQSDFRKLEFVSSNEKLYVMDNSGDEFEAFEADLNEMKWVNSERTIGEYAVFVGELKCNAAIKPDTWAHPWSRYERLNYSDGYAENRNKIWCLTTNMWYFPHECLIDNDSDKENGALANTLEE